MKYLQVVACSAKVHVSTEENGWELIKLEEGGLEVSVFQRVTKKRQQAKASPQLLYYIIKCYYRWDLLIEGRLRLWLVSVLELMNKERG